MMKKLIGILLLASISVACESNSANSAKAEPVAVDQGAAPDEASAADEPAEKPAPAEEVAEVRAIAFDKAAFPGELPKGELLGGFAFVDAADRKSTRLNSSHVRISYAVFCLKK